MDDDDDGDNDGHTGSSLGRSKRPALQGSQIFWPAWPKFAQIFGPASPAEYKLLDNRMTLGLQLFAFSLVSENERKSMMEMMVCPTQPHSLRP